MEQEFTGSRGTTYYTLNKDDKLYCSKCVYQGCYTEDYLCNYILITGEHRGCKAGVGCNKRILTNHLAPRNRKFSNQLKEIEEATKKHD